LVAELPAGAFAGPDVAAGSVLAVAGEDDPAAGAAAAGATDVPPTLLTYETRASMSAEFRLSGTMPAAFIFTVGPFRTAVIPI
jgi:hypothetical protein